MLSIRSWRKHNRRILKDVARNRIKREIALDAPLPLERVIVSTRLDQNFAAFAETIGGRCAETYFLRVLQYAAAHDGRHGRIEVTRDRFGPVVLTTAWDVVTKREGERCYDALLSSTLCVPYTRGQVCDPGCDCMVDPSADKSSDGDADKSRDDLHPASSDLHPEPSPTPSGGMDQGSAIPKPDRYVLGAIVTAMLKADASAAKASTRSGVTLRNAIKANTADPAEVRAWIEKHSPDFIEPVRSARMTISMEAKQSRPA